MQRARSHPAFRHDDDDDASIPGSANLSNPKNPLHPLRAGRRVRVRPVVRLAREPASSHELGAVVKDATDGAAHDGQQASGTVSNFDSVERQFLSYLHHRQSLAEADLPPPTSAWHALHVQGLRVAHEHIKLAAAPSLTAELRRACLQRALAAAPPAPLGTPIEAEANYALGSLLLQHGRPHAALRALKRAAGAASRLSSLRAVEARSQLNICVALQQLDEHTEALKAARRAQTALDAVSSDDVTLDATERAALRGECLLELRLQSPFSTSHTL